MGEEMTKTELLEINLALMKCLAELDYLVGDDGERRADLTLFKELQACFQLCNVKLNYQRLNGIPYGFRSESNPLREIEKADWSNLLIGPLIVVKPE